MTRVLILGNSHAGALKLGWNECRSEFSAMDVEFFAAPIGAFRLCTLKSSGRFGLIDRPDADPRARDQIRKLNGGLTVNLREFDTVVRVGYQWKLGQVIDLLGRYNIDGIHEIGAPLRMSLAGFRSICEDMAAEAAPNGHWLALNGPKLWIVGLPIPSETCLAADADPRLKAWKAAVPNGTSVGPALGIYIDAFGRALADRGIGMLPPTEATLGPLGLTRKKFTLGSRRLASGQAHPESDRSHMNADYGVLVMRDLLSRIGAPAPVQ